MTKERYEDSFRKYLDDLAAKKPAPGGGSAAALSASLGAALVSMVCNYTLGNKKYEKHEKDISRILAESEILRKKFMELVDADVEAYNKFSLSKKDEAALKDALGVPLEICEFSYKALMLCPELAEKGNKYLVSDAGCAAELLEGAFFSALFNVEINLAGITDKDYINKINNIVDPLKKEVVTVKNSTVKKVKGKVNKQ